MKSHTSSRRRSVAAALAGAVLLLASCGSDDDSSADTTAAATEATEAPAATEPATETTEAAVEETTAPVETEAPEVTEAPTTEAPAMFEGDLVGTFGVDAAVCDDPAAVTGSYFRMLQPDGTTYIPNADSVCADPTFSGLAPGTDGGLITGDWQPSPDPAFDDAGNALAAGIVEPVTFFAVAFAGATDPAEAMPTLGAEGGVLSGDLSAFTAYYGGSNFNQGAPKPDGAGDPPVGTIDPETGVYVLDWTSLIVGGSFDGFVGEWHFEGTFTPAG
jgi:hypothetical protein